MTQETIFSQLFYWNQNKTESVIHDGNQNNLF